MNPRRFASAFAALVVAAVSAACSGAGFTPFGGEDGKCDPDHCEGNTLVTCEYVCANGAVACDVMSPKTSRTDCGSEVCRANGVSVDSNGHGGYACMPSGECTKDEECCPRDSPYSSCPSTHCEAHRCITDRDRDQSCDDETMRCTAGLTCTDHTNNGVLSRTCQ